jgi:hypothetical protein
LLTLRRAELSGTPSGGARVTTLPNKNGVALERHGKTRTYLVVVQLRDSGLVELDALGFSRSQAAGWRCVLTTEDPRYCPDPKPVAVRLEGPKPAVEFLRPGAALLEKAS